jgi:hypothetical protein
MRSNIPYLSVAFPAGTSLFFLVGALAVSFPPLVSNVDVLWGSAKHLCLHKMVLQNEGPNRSIEELLREKKGIG